MEWPTSGIPRTPEAWLLTVARRKLIDAARRRQTGNEAAGTVVLLADELSAVVAAADDEMEIPDERLRLMFACAHPAIDAGVRAPLILQAVLGFDAATIASAFLVAPATMGQRLVRAKNRIRQAGIPFRVPERAELAKRLDAVLEAIYAIYAEGWSDPVGTHAGSRGLTEEAIWLGRPVASLLPQEPEVLGLLALMLHAEARRDAGPDGRANSSRSTCKTPHAGTLRSSPRQKSCFCAPAVWARLVAFSSKPPSSRHMRRGASRARQTGRESCSCMTRCTASLTRSWSPSTAPSRA